MNLKHLHLSKMLKKYGAVVIDLNKHLKNREECVFAVYIQCQNKCVRISEYLYHSDDICYTNFGMNYLIKYGLIKMFNKLNSHQNMMKAINYTSPHEENLFQDTIDNFEKMHLVHIKQKKLALKVNNGRKDAFRIIIRNNNSNWGETADDW